MERFERFELYEGHVAAPIVRSLCWQIHRERAGGRRDLARKVHYRVLSASLC